MQPIGPVGHLDHDEAVAAAKRLAPVLTIEGRGSAAPWARLENVRRWVGSPGGGDRCWLAHGRIVAGSRDT